MTQFLLFVMAILLILIFWELSKIHTRLKMGPRSQMESTKKREETSERPARTQSRLTQSPELGLGPSSFKNAL